MKTTSAIEKIIESGTKAPSGHNTQPWKFLINKNEIQIHPDFNRALPIVDSDNHTLYISLGCAAENIVISAKNKGFDTQVIFSKSKKGTNFISIQLTPDDNIRPDDLFDCIDRRQVTRSHYSSISIPIEDLEILKRSSSFEGVKTTYFTEFKDFIKLRPFIIEASNLQFENKYFVDELVSWIRFSKKEAEKKKDGIWSASMGMPNTGRLIGNMIMKRIVSARSEAKRWKKTIKATAGFALFSVEKNDVRHWVDLGRLFQRFGLTATKLNINHAHVNMPCEVIEVRKKMAKSFGLKNTVPLLLIRFGYSEKLPYSYRRPLEQVVDTI